MALYNQNYQSISLEAGTGYTTSDLGDGITATTVHNVFCVSGGTITLQTFGGGTPFTWTATAGQDINIILGSCSVVSGLFVGFKTHKGVGPFRP